VSQVLIIDRRGNLARLSFGQRSRSGSKVLPLSINLRYELGVTDLCLCGVSCT
jgi:hypothetical protein